MKEILVLRNDEYGTYWYHEKLIQCKDCKYFDGEYCHSEDLNLCLEPMGFSGALFYPPEDFYCAYAKGKE